MSPALHPLAIEDLLTDRISSPSKAEYFPQHLFVRAAGPELVDDDLHNRVDKKIHKRHNNHDSWRSSKNPTPSEKSKTARRDRQESHDVESNDTKQKSLDPFGLLHWVNYPLPIVSSATLIALCQYRKDRSERACELQFGN